MRNTDFAVTFKVTVTVFDRPWNLTCTASPMWEDPPAILWLETDDKDSPWVPSQVWDAVESELANHGPARQVFEAALEKASFPFMAGAAQ